MKNDNRFQWVWPLMALLAICVAFVALSIKSLQNRSMVVEKPKLLERIHSIRMELLIASQAQDVALIAHDEHLVKQSVTESADSLARIEEAIAVLQKDSNAYFEPALVTGVESQFRVFRNFHSQIAEMISQSTNRKAYALATVEGMALLRDLDAQLALLIANEHRITADDQSKLAPAYEVRLSLLKIQTALIPHIFEATDAAMNEIELQIDAEDAAIQKNLDLLSSAPVAKDSLTILIAKVEEFRKLRNQIVTLSRQNSNVRSESLAVRQRRDALLACESALVQLVEVINSRSPTTMIPRGR